MLFHVVLLFCRCGCLLRLAGVELLLRSLLTASGSVLVLKPLPSIKVRYVFGVLSKKNRLLFVDNPFSPLLVTLDV